MLKQIEEDVTRGIIKSAIDGIAESAYHFNESHLKSAKWTVVPMESASHFSTNDCNNIAVAARASGNRFLYAQLTEPLMNAVECYELDASVWDLTKFSKTCGHFGYVLAPKSMEFAILCSPSYYFLIGGPRNFVLKAIAEKIVQARRAFLTSAKNDYWNEKERKLLWEVNYRYSKYD